jgi:hypothetical protein
MCAEAEVVVLFAIRKVNNPFPGQQPRSRFLRLFAVFCG